MFGWLRRRRRPRPTGLNLLEQVGTEVLAAVRAVASSAVDLANLRRQVAHRIENGEYLSDETLQKMRDVDTREADWLQSLRE